MWCCIYRELVYLFIIFYHLSLLSKNTYGSISITGYAITGIDALYSGSLLVAGMTVDEMLWKIGETGLADGAIDMGGMNEGVTGW